MGIFGEDETPPRGARRRRPSSRRRKEVSLDVASYKIDVEYVQKDTGEDERGEVTVDFRLSATVEDPEAESHWPELSGNVTYKAPSGGAHAADLGDKISEAYTAVGYALMKWAKDAEERS